MYLWALPKPVVSDEELEGIGNASVESLRMVWNSLSQDPIKATILRAIFPHTTNHGGLCDGLCGTTVLSSSSTNGREKLLTEMLSALELALVCFRYTSSTASNMELTSSSSYAIAGLCNR